MNKTFFFLLLFTISGYSAISQEFDQRLMQKYSKSEITNLQKNNPEEYNYLVNALDKGVYISEIPMQKASSITFNGTLNIDLSKKHTFISLGKEITDSYQYYKIEGTTKMLCILPRIALDKRVLKEKTTK